MLPSPCVTPRPAPRVRPAETKAAASLTPGARFVVCVRTEAELPLGGVVTVNGQYGVSVDSFRTGRG